MKIIATFAAVAALFVAPLSTALAVDIVNEDETPYEVLVTSGGDTMTIDIEPEATLGDVCDSCNLEIEGEEPISAEGKDVVRIRDGMLSIER